MKFTKKQMSLEEGITKEWIITNGIGGYASSTIIGANTRKYHGLLVAALRPPAKRTVILSKLDESIEIDKTDYPFYTNVCKNHISEGFKFQEEFRKEYIPIFSYKIKEITIKKLICMEYGKNTVCIMYKVQNKLKKKAKLKLAPVLNFRDFHSMNTNHKFNIKQESNEKKVKIIIDENTETPIYMNISEGNYIKHENDIFYNMFYLEEEKRGFFPEENHIVTGVYEVEIAPQQEKEISFVCSLEENIEETISKDIISGEIVRINEFFNKTLLINTRKELKTKKEIEQEELIKDYLMAIDNFIVKRPSFGLYTILAGYPWFLDWGRDTLIAFEGLLLKTRMFDIAKEILLTIIRDIKYGLVPNGYSGYDNRPLYNSVDASLLLFEQVQKYINYTGDYKFVKEKLYKKLVNIIDSYIEGINVDDNNIYLDSEDFLISSGTDFTQNTWMDAKYEDMAITPRNGKVVEVNAMWYNALKVLENLVKEFETKEKARKYEDLAKKTKKSFEEKLYNSKKKCLFDVVGDDKIRPNQLFSISLTYPVLDPTSDIAKEMFETVTKKLLNRYGLKTLAKGEKGYIEIYEGNNFKRDMSYHQGITWTWLLGLYNDAYKNRILHTKLKKEKKAIQEEYKKFIDNVYITFKKELHERGAIGSIAEIYDSKTPYLPKGAIAQAWSVSEVFKIILEKEDEK